MYTDWATAALLDSEPISATEAESFGPSADSVLNKWLAWRPSVEQEESRKSSNRNAVLAVATNPVARSILGEDIKSVPALVSTSRWWNVAAPFKCSLWSRRLTPEPRNLRAMLVQGVLEHWGHFKHCANRECVSPYFIAKRKDQTVCDAEICKAERQREHARKWWNENRAQKSPKKTEVARKSIKKGTAKNVAKEAR
jgi:hypothetical protein